MTAVISGIFPCDCYSSFGSHLPVDVLTVEFGMLWSCSEGVLFLFLSTLCGNQSTTSKYILNELPRPHSSFRMEGKASKRVAVHASLSPACKNKPTNHYHPARGVTTEYELVASIIKHACLPQETLTKRNLDGMNTNMVCARH